MAELKNARTEAGDDKTILIRRYKNLPLQNRHQVRHHLENNPYPEVLAHVANVPGSHSFWWIFDVYFAQFLDIWFHGVSSLRGLYHRIHKNYAEDHLLRALDIISVHFFEGDVLVVKVKFQKSISCLQSDTLMDHIQKKKG